MVTALLGAGGCLLFEHRAGRLVRSSILGFPDVGVAQIAREQCAALVGNLRGNGQRPAVHRLEEPFLADQPQLLTVRVVGEGLDHVGSGVDEVTVQLTHHLRVLEHDFRHVGPGLKVAAALELEEIALRADDRSRGETLDEIR